MSANLGKEDFSQLADSVRPALPLEASSLPRVSILIPYYMQAAFIAATVRSARAQTYPNVEIIVVDDGSPIPAERYLIDEDNILLLRTENHGCPATRNFAFQQSSGEYLIFLDGDDLLPPDAVEAHLKAFGRRIDASVSFGSVRILDELGHVTRPPHVCRPRKDYFQMLLETNPIWSPGAAMIRRSAFEQAGMFDASLSAQVDDYDLYLRLARRGPFARHTSCTLDYRLHGNNVSRDQEKMLRGTLGVLDRLEASGQLTVRELRRLRYGRRRWMHEFRPQQTVSYRLRGLYYRIRSMLAVSPRDYLSRA